ncbi:MAG: hypothetical protein JXA66_08455 [Oligoflexia bacterium]|nr:hypothetical protein [Oligoflexia bacterium]
MKKLFAASLLLFILAMTVGNTIDEFLWLKKPSSNAYIKDAYINALIKNKQVQVKSYIKNDEEIN